MDVMVTGGCGFIGSNFIRHALGARPDIRILNVDKLTYAGNLASLSRVEEKFPGRYRFLRGDIADRSLILGLFTTENIDWLVHFAAESHVDRSIL
ncbi:MAG: GDP-mannose 4,6-dehydratase, partial [Deltaproteobacteria bacterium]|nr:GDP-mannose 4,6-dehydratase [Deltaproteobacteria bacterium]